MFSELGNTWKYGMISLHKWWLREWFWEGLVSSEADESPISTEVEDVEKKKHTEISDVSRGKAPIKADFYHYVKTHVPNFADFSSNNKHGYEIPHFRKNKNKHREHGTLVMARGKKRKAFTDEIWLSLYGLMYENKKKGDRAKHEVK